MGRNGLFTLLLFWVPWLGAGQPNGQFAVKDQPLRIEIPAQSDRETYRIIPCGSTGMILFYKSVEISTDNTTRWYFSYFDRNLQKVWVKSAPIVSSLEYRDAEVGGDTLCLFFESDKKNRNREINFQILRISLASGSFILNNGNTPEQGTMATFDLFGQKAFIGLNNDAGKPAIMIMDLPTGQPVVIPVNAEDHSSILYGSLNPVNGRLTLLLSRTVSKRSAELYLCRYLPDGTKEFEVRVGSNNPLNEFTNVTEISTPGSGTLIAGTYTAGPAGKKVKEVESTGLVTASFNTVIQESVDYYNFLDLKNSNILLSDQDMLSLRKKSMKKSRPDQEYSLDFSLLIHPIIPLNDQYILTAEAYNPQYHTESFTDYDFYGRPYTNTYSVFDGYRFTGVIIGAFNQQGKLLWDNAMPVRNLLSLSLEPQITLFPMGDEIILTYLSEGKIACRIIREGETVEKTTYSELELMSPNDKLLDESASRMVHWYEDYFLCSGFQEIRDISKGGNDKRMVFFINKVKFDR